jgi:hypothetical protein
MNFLTSKTFLGLVTVFVSSALGLLRALGLSIPASVDPAINQVLINGVGLYLLIAGHQEALYTTPPVAKAETESKPIPGTGIAVSSMTPPQAQEVPARDPEPIITPPAA